MLENKPSGRLERAEAILVGLAKVIGAVALVIGAIYGVSTAVQPFIPPSSTVAVSPATSSSRPGLVAVQNVYNLPEVRGLKIIADQGYTNVRVERVCSNSVAEGRIRQVLLDNGTELVGANGGTGIEVSLSERIRVKVSTGQGCP